MREMRRKRQALDKDCCEEILNRNTSGVLAVYGDEGYPYAVPLSFVYEDGNIYFHCAYQGHKLDAIKNCSKVSFCVIDKDEVLPEKYTTRYRSVIAFGKAEILEAEQKQKALEALAEKYSPMLPEGRQKEIENNFDRTCMVKISVEHLTGKQAKELITAN